MTRTCDLLVRSPKVGCTPMSVTSRFVSLALRRRSFWIRLYADFCAGSGHSSGQSVKSEFAGGLNTLRENRCPRPSSTSLSPHRKIGSSDSPSLALRPISGAVPCMWCSFPGDAGGDDLDRLRHQPIHRHQSESLLLERVGLVPSLIGSSRDKSTGVLEAAGVELSPLSEQTQVTDFNKTAKTPESILPPN